MFQTFKLEDQIVIIGVVVYSLTFLLLFTGSTLYHSSYNLAQRVKELRNRKGISQEILAEESGLSLRTIQRIENNETVPRGDTLKRLAIALDTSPDEIIDWKILEDQNYLILELDGLKIKNENGIIRNYIKRMKNTVKYLHLALLDNARKGF